MSSASLIIPTYKRVFFIDRIIRSLLSQDVSLLKEIIIVDSDSNDGTKELVASYKNNKKLNLIYENVDNSVGLKRNKGIKVAKSEYLIFIDDDCIPLNGFVADHINSCREQGKQINCGSVYFSKYFVKESNYIRYRDSRHAPYRNDIKIDKILLDYRSIVTMNMSIRRKDLIDNNLFFNKSFIGYGMEDNEFGCKAENLGFNICYTNASIVHLESGNAQEYAKKIYHTSRDGVSKFKKINPEAIEKLRYSFYFEKDYKHDNMLESFSIKVFRAFFNIKIAKLMLRALVATDQIKILYTKHCYRYVYACYYKKGVEDRNNAYQLQTEVSRSWYKEDL